MKAVHLAVTAWTVGSLALVTLGAQALEFSGTWRLNRADSRIVTGVGLDGLGAGGAPSTLYLTHAANGSVLMGSDVNESEARLYRIDGAATLPPPKTGGARTPITSRVEGRRLLSEGTGFKEELALSPDGRTLTITITKTVSSSDSSSSTLVFTKMEGVDACTAWPTPCKY